jgi:AcrR family transcriptional regulator
MVSPIIIGVNNSVLSMFMAQKDELDPRERMVRAALDLLASGGREAVSTRAVSAAAGVQPPTIYRHFGDMRGLLDAAASRGFDDYLANKKARRRQPDPVDDLRRGWDLHVEFGLTHPGVYTLIYGDPRPDTRPAALREGDAILRGLVQRIAEAGHLRVSAERAARMMASACQGVTLMLISTPVAERDEGLSTATREAILSVITDDGAARENRGDDLPRRHAVALKAVLAKSRVLTPAEAALLSEWLDRLSRGPTRN